MADYIEQDCTIRHGGQDYTAGGAVITAGLLIAYPAKDGALTDWHGRTIGTWRAVSSWRVNSFIGSRMYQIEAVVNGATYTGRGFGEGMIYRGRPKRGRG